MDPDRRIAITAAKQHGAFARHQATKAGFTRAEMRHRIRSGRWIDVHRATYVLAGAPQTWEQAVIAAVLSIPSGAAASYLTAASLSDLVEDQPDVIDVTVRHGWPPVRRGVVTHQARGLRRSDVSIVSGIAVTAPWRTLVDMAGTVARPTLETAVDAALVARRIAIPSTLARIEERRVGHLRGVGELRAILHDRKDGVPMSELERDFERYVIRPYGLPKPVRQQGAGPRKIDYAYPDLRIMIELDGATWHSSAAALRDACRRQNTLALDGWFPLHYTRDDVRNHHRVVAGEMWAAIAQRSGRS